MRRLTHVYTPPCGSVKLLVWCNRMGAVMHAQGVQDAWGDKVGVWMARIEKRSDANPEPRSAIRADEAEQR